MPHRQGRKQANVWQALDTIPAFLQHVPHPDVHGLLDVHTIYMEPQVEAYAELFALLDDALSERAWQQLQAEVAFLTHNAELHEVNLGWHPKGEEWLWQPDIQETKVSATGGVNLRYKRPLKRVWVEEFCALLRAKLPYCAKIASAYKVGYVSAKHGLLGLTRTVALELAPYGITVNAICPGYVDTPLVRNQLADLATAHHLASEEEALATLILRNMPMKQLIAPQEVASLALFLCSPSARSMTAQGSTLDAGLTQT